MKRFLHGLLLACLSGLASAASLNSVATMAFGGPSLPAFSVACGSYSSAQAVSLSTATFGAVMHYTTDGSTPTPSSSLYTLPVSIATSSTLRAISTAPLIGSSAIVSCSYTITGGSSGIKFHVGNWLDSSLFSSVGNPNSAGKASEIAFMHTNPSIIKGYEAYYFWSLFEPTTLGVYNFNQLDTDYVGVTGWVSGTPTACGGSGATYTDPRHLGIYMLQTNYFDNDPTGFLPTYITSNSTYGPVGPDGVHYGYWTDTGQGGFGTGSTAALYRASVMARYTAMLQHMASHVLPDGCTVDGSPYVEWVKEFLETASLQPQNAGTTNSGSAADSTFSASGQQTQIAALNAAMAAAFPHTTYGTPANFTGDTGNEDVTLLLSMPATRTAETGPDVFGLTSGANVPFGLTFGQAAYIGLVPPASGNPFTTNWVTNNGTISGVDQRGIIPVLATIQCTEMVATCGVHYTSQDLFNQANMTLHAPMLAWTYIFAGQYSGATTDAIWLGTASSMTQWLTAPGTWGGVLDTIWNNAITYTSCPSSYSSSGGCNTSFNLPSANDDYFHQRLEGRFGTTG